MSNGKLKLRPVTVNDCRRVWLWRNERSGLKNYFNDKPVPWDVHQKWFAAKLADPKSRFFVIESAGQPIGQIRVELDGRKTAEVHVVLDKKSRGKGFGRAGIEAAADKIFKSTNVAAVVAHTKPSNLPSVIAFLKAGFYFKQWIKVHGVDCYQFAKDRP